MVLLQHFYIVQVTMPSSPKLILQPNHSSTTEILKKFAMNKPLNCSELNFMTWHQKKLSSQSFDPVYKYYIESAKKNSKYNKSFLLPTGNLTNESNKHLKERLQLFVTGENNYALIKFTAHQFLQFKELNDEELIFWHGDQFLADAPFFPGGIPPIVHFQWGNLHGIVKQVIMAEEKELKANLFIYFEDLYDQTLDQCVTQYQQKIANDLALQRSLLIENKIATPAFKHFLIKTF